MVEADCWRYSAEFKEEKEQNEEAEKAEVMYREALGIARRELGAADPVVLSLVLNYSVFLCEIKGEVREAIELGENAVAEGRKVVGELERKDQEEAKVVMQLLTDNIALWRED
jgi:14-3-3 protein epsilon